MATPHTYPAYRYTTFTLVQGAIVSTGRHLALETERRLPFHTVVGDVLPTKTENKYLVKRRISQYIWINRRLSKLNPITIH